MINVFVLIVWLLLICMRNRYLKRVSWSPSLQTPSLLVGGSMPLFLWWPPLSFSSFPGASYRVWSQQCREWWGGHTPFPDDPLLGVVQSWGLLLVVAGWREFGSSSVFWLTGCFTGARTSGRPLSLSTLLTHCHTHVLSWSFVIKSTQSVSCSCEPSLHFPKQH